MLKGIVFDLDGTLVDSLGFTFEAFNHAIEAHGGKRRSPTEIMKHFGVGEGQIFARILGEEHAETAYAALQKYTDENTHRVPLHAGVGELLERLESEGTPISIFTGRSWDTTEMILKHHGLLDRFVTVVAHDHCSQGKPSPEGLHLCLRRMRLDPSQVMMVGDMPADIRAARLAGAPSVAALWDLLARREILELENPDHWAESPDQVWAVWERVRG